MQDLRESLKGAKDSAEYYLNRAVAFLTKTTYEIDRKEPITWLDAAKAIVKTAGNYGMDDGVTFAECLDVYAHFDIIEEDEERFIEWDEKDGLFFLFGELRIDPNEYDRDEIMNFVGNYFYAR